MGLTETSKINFREHFFMFSREILDKGFVPWRIGAGRHGGGEEGRREGGNEGRRSELI